MADLGASLTAGLHSWLPRMVDQDSDSAAAAPSRPWLGGSGAMPIAETEFTKSSAEEPSELYSPGRGDSSGWLIGTISDDSSSKSLSPEHGIPKLHWLRPYESPPELDIDKASPARSAEEESHHLIPDSIPSISALQHWLQCFTEAEAKPQSLNKLTVSSESKPSGFHVSFASSPGTSLSKPLQDAHVGEPATDDESAKASVPHQVGKWLIHGIILKALLGHPADLQRLSSALCSIPDVMSKTASQALCTGHRVRILRMFAAYLGGDSPNLEFWAGSSTENPAVRAPKSANVQGENSPRLFRRANLALSSLAGMQERFEKDDMESEEESEEDGEQHSCEGGLSSVGWGYSHEQLLELWGSDDEEEYGGGVGSPGVRQPRKALAVALPSLIAQGFASALENVLDEVEAQVLQTQLHMDSLVAEEYFEAVGTGYNDKLGGIRKGALALGRTEHWAWSEIWRCWMFADVDWRIDDISRRVEEIWAIASFLFLKENEEGVSPDLSWTFQSARKAEHGQRLSDLLAETVTHGTGGPIDGDLNTTWEPEFSRVPLGTNLLSRLHVLLMDEECKLQTGNGLTDLHSLFVAAMRPYLVMAHHWLTGREMSLVDPHSEFLKDPALLRAALGSQAGRGEGSIAVPDFLSAARHQLWAVGLEIRLLHGATELASSADPLFHQKELGQEVGNDEGVREHGGLGLNGRGFGHGAMNSSDASPDGNDPDGPESFDGEVGLGIGLQASRGRGFWGQGRIRLSEVAPTREERDANLAALERALAGWAGTAPVEDRDWAAFLDVHGPNAGHEHDEARWDSSTGLSRMLAVRHASDRAACSGEPEASAGLQSWSISGGGRWPLAGACDGDSELQEEQPGGAPIGQSGTGVDDFVEAHVVGPLRNTDHCEQLCRFFFLEASGADLASALIDLVKDKATFGDSNESLDIPLENSLASILPHDDPLCTRIFIKLDNTHADMAHGILVDTAEGIPENTAMGMPVDSTDGIPMDSADAALVPPEFQRVAFWYQADWPASLVFTCEVMSKYNELLRFLLGLHSVPLAACSISKHVKPFLEGLARCFGKENEQSQHWPRDTHEETGAQHEAARGQHTEGVGQNEATKGQHIEAGGQNEATKGQHMEAGGQRVGTVEGDEEDGSRAAQSLHRLRCFAFTAANVASEMIYEVGHVMREERVKAESGEADGTHKDLFTLRKRQLQMLQLCLKRCQALQHSRRDEMQILTKCLSVAAALRAGEDFEGLAATMDDVEGLMGAIRSRSDAP